VHSAAMALLLCRVVKQRNCANECLLCRNLVAENLSVV
jgi:hypothetical protein